MSFGHVVRLADGGALASSALRRQPDALERGKTM